MTKLTIKELTAIRNEHRADTKIGYRCSNIIELMQLPELPQAQYDRQISDLRRLLAAAEPAASRASHYS